MGPLDLHCDIRPIFQERWWLRNSTEHRRVLVCSHGRVLAKQI